MSTETEMPGAVGLPDAGVKSYSTASVAAAAVGGAIVAFFLSWAYGPAEHYSPIIYLNFALAYGMAWVVGAAVRGILRKRKIDRAFPAIVAGGVAGLACWWFAWLAYVWVIYGYNFEVYFVCLTHPQYIFYEMMELAESPMWSMGKSKGGDPAFFYYIAWLLEAGVMIGLPANMGRVFVKENLLCDHCQDWVRATGDTALFDPGEGEVAGIAATLKAGDITPLLSMARLAPDSEAAQWLEASGSACPNCQDKDSYVSVTLVTMKKAKKKQPEMVRLQLAHHIQIDVETERALFEPAEKPGAETAAKAENLGTGPV